MPDNKMAYIGRCKCGVVIGATVDSETHRKEVIRFIDECLRDGLDIERIPVSEVGALFGSCKCEPLQPTLFGPDDTP